MGLFLDDGNGDVGAVVGDTLQVCQVVVEDEAHLDGALTALQAQDVAGADLLDETVDGFFQSFHTAGLIHIVGVVGGEGAVHDLVDGGADHLQLGLGGVGELELLLVELTGVVLEVHAVVADTLEVADGVENTGNHTDIVGGSALLGDMHQVTAQAVLIDVQLVLVFGDLGLPGFGVLVILLHGKAEGLPGQVAHLPGKVCTLGNSHSRGTQQQGVQEGDLPVLLVFLHHLLGQLFQLLGEGQQQAGGENIEDGVAHGDAGGGNGGSQELEAHNGVGTVEQHQADGGTDEVEGGVDGGDLLCVAVDADGADDRSNGGADVLAHDDGNGGAVADGAGEGQGLQNTNRSGGGLDDGGEDRAEQHTQDGIGEGGEQAGEGGHFRNGLHGAAHELHAGHQHGEAHQHPADVPAALLLGSHDEQNADEGQQGREILGFEELHEDVAALKARQGQDPGGDGGADVGTHDDADGLAEGHDAGVDKAHQHDGDGGGGLDGHGDADTQQQALEGVGGHAFEQALQLAAGHFLQALGHQVHAVEEESQATQECEDGKDIHFVTPFVSLQSKEKVDMVFLSLRTNSLYMLSSGERNWRNDQKSGFFVKIA